MKIDAAAPNSPRAMPGGSRERTLSLVSQGKIFGQAITFLQVCADYFSVFACYLGAYLFYTRGLGGWAPQSFLSHFALSGVVAALYVVFADRVGLYRREISLLNVRELRGIFRVSLYGALAVLSVSFYIRSTSFSRITLTVAMISAPLVLYIQRHFFYRLHVAFHQRGWSRRRALVFGAGHIGLHLVKRLFQSPSLGYLPVAFLDDDVSKRGTSLRWTGIGPKSGLPVLGGEEDLARIKLELGIDMVFIALPSATMERNQKLLEKCEELHLGYAVVPTGYGRFVEELETFEIGGIPLIRKRSIDPGWIYNSVKRLQDFVIAFLCIVLGSPIVGFFAVLIKLDSKGPVLFKQKRVGYRGRLFSFYKFRTMHVDAPQYARSPSDVRDPRITRVGRWLRRTSLDELPQLFNVLRGDMSLVGPRPEMPFIVETYTKLERKRLEAKPGITGVWQISAVRGEPIHANLEYDLFYLDHRSLLLDFAILVKTALSVVRGVGAV